MAIQKCYQLKAKNLRGIILHEHFENEKTVLPKERLTNILNLIKARAELKPDIRDKGTKLACCQRMDGNGDDFCYLYDLTNPNWEVVKITSEGWEITSPIHPYSKDTEIACLRSYPTKTIQRI